MHIAQPAGSSSGFPIQLPLLYLNGTLLSTSPVDLTIGRGQEWPPTCSRRGRGQAAPALKLAGYSRKSMSAITVGACSFVSALTSSTFEFNSRRILGNL